MYTKLHIIFNYFLASDKPYVPIFGCRKRHLPQQRQAAYANPDDLPSSNISTISLDSEFDKFDFPMEEIEERPTKSSKFSPRQVKPYQQSTTSNRNTPFLYEKKVHGVQNQRYVSIHQHSNQPNQKQVSNKENLNGQPFYPRKLMPMPNSSNVNMSKPTAQNIFQQRHINQRLDNFQIDNFSIFLRLNITNKVD